MGRPSASVRTTATAVLVESVSAQILLRTVPELGAPPYHGCDRYIKRIQSSTIAVGSRTIFTRDRSCTVYPSDCPAQLADKTNRQIQSEPPKAVIDAVRHTVATRRCYVGRIVDFQICVSRGVHDDHPVQRKMPATPCRTATNAIQVKIESVREKVGADTVTTSGCTSS